MKKNNPFQDSQDDTLWEAYIKPRSFNKLDKNLDTEVLIIGGGIAGITTAYNLLKAGKKVTLIEEQSSLGNGQTSNTTAHLTYCLDIRYFKLQEQIGQENAMRVANSHSAAIEWMDRTIRLEKINCNFKRINGYLYSPSLQTIQLEYETTRSLGLITEMSNKVPGIQLSENYRCIKFPEQAQVHIIQYLKGLTQAVISMGAQIYVNTRAEHISEKEVIANGYKIKAEHIVITVNSDLNNEILNSNQKLARSYVIATKIPKGKLPYSLWWELPDSKEQEQGVQSYHYARLEGYDDLNDMLIVGGEDVEVNQPDEKVSNEEKKYANLFDWAKKRFSIDEKPEHKWSGVISYSDDGLAFIGKYKYKNCYIITGDSGNGINYATIGSLMITDSICGKK